MESIQNAFDFGQRQDAKCLEQSSSSLICRLHRHVLLFFCDSLLIFVFMCLPFFSYIFVVFFFTFLSFYLLPCVGASVYSKMYSCFICMLNNVRFKTEKSVCVFLSKQYAGFQPKRKIIVTQFVCPF